MLKVLVSDKVAESGLKKLKDAGFQVDMKTGLSEDELVKIIPQYDALVVRSQTKVTPKIIEAGKNLKIIARAGVGVDNVDLPAATKKGIIVVNSPEGNTVAAAEHSFAMLLAMVRNIPQAQASLRSGKWERSKFTGVELYGKTLGVLGLGKIGSHVASYGVAFGMKVIGSDPFVSKEYADKLGVELKDVDSILKESDYITLHLPKNKDTINLINAEKIKLMKDGVRLVNCARGGIVNEKDLTEALKSKKIAAAAIDVYDKEPVDPNNPLLSLDNAVTVPHLGAATVEAQVNVAVDVVEQIVDVLKGGTARSAVNIPSMKPKILAAAAPYMSLAEKMGKLAGQLAGEAIKEVNISYVGEVADIDTSPLTVAVLKGLLGPILEGGVTFVNAPIVVKERGIKVIESKIKESEDFTNKISVSVGQAKTKRVVEGSLFGTLGERIVGIDGFSVDAIPSGNLIIASNIDKPGIIGNIGTVLGKNKINIAGMEVGRNKVGEKAVMVLNIDTPISDKGLKEIEKIPGIHTAKLVSL
ncbi:phosphoglycerate dehydrogenase [Candidatus Margulisiibacteriota bacterium]